MYRQRKGNKKTVGKRSLLIKAVLCLLGIVALTYIVFSYRNYRIKEEKAPYVQVKEVLPVLTAFFEVNEGLNMEAQSAVQKLLQQLKEKQNQEEGYLSYDELIAITNYFPIETTEMFNDYRDVDWYIGLEDWNQFVEILVREYGNDQITLQEKLILATSEMVTNEEHVPIADNQILTDTGIAENEFWNIQTYLFSKSKSVCYGNRILTITGFADSKGIVENVYMADRAGSTMHFFWNGHHITYPVDVFDKIPENYENTTVIGKITDIALDKGNVYLEKEKDEYVHGKLMQVSEDSIEIEGYGMYPIAPNMQIYKLYGELESMDKEELRIGYSFTDFVIEDGKIAACLVMKEEDMEYIRVLLKNSDLAGIYHDSFLAYCDKDCEIIIYQNGAEADRIAVKQGERFTLDAKDLKGENDRIKVVPSVLSGKTTVESINRNQGIPSYLGTLEITKEEEGLIIINEVLLEDYLCKVVPSEMPASYPKEALMAQAVCARTYAYGKMLNAGLPSLGAHVDDSAGFQVYNNIDEQATATEAVKATHDTIAVYDNKPIGAYYYSTSCGMGTDTGVWHSGADSPMYLKAQEIGSSGNTEDVLFTDSYMSPQELTKEENFSEWIKDVKDSHYESQEGWYRWTYEVNKLDVVHMEEMLKKRYNSNPNMILTQNNDGEFESKEIEKLGEIKEIEITKRLDGGVADELIITGTKTTVKVISELNIRYVLSDGVTKVKRQTGDEADASSMLPSAYFVIETEKEDERVSGYKIFGGGFGHGVGMSQNGAKNMALNGMTYDEIILFYYPGVTLKNLQPGE